MTTDNSTTDESYRDDSGLAGVAVGVNCVKGGTMPGIVRGTEDIVIDGETLATRVRVETDDGEIVDTDAGRVEVV